MTDTSLDATKEIPKQHGLPILGQAIGFYKSLMKLQCDIYTNSNNSPVIETKLLNEKPILLYGADAHQLVLHNSSGVFSSEGGWERLLEYVFPGSVIATDGKNHRYQRRIMQSAFKKDVLEGYLSIMRPVADNIISNWDTNKPILVYPSIKHTLLEIASPTFLGQSLDNQTDDTLDAFIDCVDATVALIRKPIPPFKLWKGIKSRKKLEKLFKELLVEKRKIQTPDFFSQFCHAKTDEGEQFSDTEIIDHMIFLLMAAHDTTSSALTTIIYHLGKNVAWQDKLREEILTAGDTLDYNTLSTMELTSKVFRESMRLHPSVPVLTRKTTESINFKGYQIPKGRLVSLCTLQMHHDPELWVNPEKFDPDRFSDERAEHKDHRFKYVPFGGGAHMCIGQHFAEMQVKVIMSTLLRKYKWTLPESYEMPYQQIPIPKPKDDLPITFTNI
jgi:cytochrome P450